MKKEKDFVLTIKEEVKIPGTDIILEKGDKVKVLKERSYVSTVGIEISKMINNVWDSLWDKEIAQWQKDYPEFSMEELEIESGKALLADLAKALEFKMNGSVEINWD